MSECAAVGWPDPMLIKAQIHLESSFDPRAISDDTPCGIEPGWTSMESGSHGLFQMTPACGVQESDMGLYTAGHAKAGHPILVTSTSDPYWPQSLYNGNFTIHFGMYIMNLYTQNLKARFPGCTTMQYMLMALATHIEGPYRASGCGRWTSRAQNYIDRVFVRYHDFCRRAGYPNGFL